MTNTLFFELTKYAVLRILHMGIEGASFWSSNIELPRNIFLLQLSHTYYFFSRYSTNLNIVKANAYNKGSLKRNFLYTDKLHGVLTAEYDYGIELVEKKITLLIVQNW